MARRPVVAMLRSFAIVSAAALALVACSGVQQTVDGWLGRSSTTDASAPQTYFAAVAGLPVYAEPSSDAKVLGRLDLHEKVVRTAVVSGYARVAAPDSDLAGYVDNAQLIWRLPADAGTSAPAAPTASPSPEDTPAVPAPTPEPALTPEPTDAPEPTDDPEPVDASDPADDPDPADGPAPTAAPARDPGPFDPF